MPTLYNDRTRIGMLWALLKLLWKDHRIVMISCPRILELEVNVEDCGDSVVSVINIKPGVGDVGQRIRSHEADLGEKHS